MGIRRALTACALAWASLGAAAQDATIESRVKAAYLYKFASYVEWPSNAFPATDATIVIGVANAYGIAQELEQALLGRQVANRSFKVVRVARERSAPDCCHILFIGAATDRVAAEMLSHYRGLPVLTVTESASSHPAGSVINFVVAADRVRFDISREAAERNRLQLRSQLLTVAREVVP